MQKVVFILLVFFPTLAIGKIKSNLVQYFNTATYHATLLNAGIGMPPHFVNGRIQPGFELGILKSLKFNKKEKWNYSIAMGYFAQKSLQRSQYLKIGIGYLVNPKHIIKVRPTLNFSLMNVTQINDEFQFVGNGQYEKVNKNRVQVMPSFGLESVVTLKKTKKMNIGILMKYQFGLQLPFSNLSSILPMNQIHLGVNFKNN